VESEFLLGGRGISDSYGLQCLRPMDAFEELGGMGQFE
jgi:hypothetical protein